MLLCSGWCCPSPEASTLDPGFPEHMSLELAQSHLRGQTCGMTATHRGACSKGPWALAGWPSSSNDTGLFGKQLKAQFSFVLREHVETCCMGHGRVCLFSAGTHCTRKVFHFKVFKTGITAEPASCPLIFVLPSFLHLSMGTQQAKVN